MPNRWIKESEGQKPMNEEIKKHEFEAAPAAEAANTDTQQLVSAPDAAVPAVDMREDQTPQKKAPKKKKHLVRNIILIVILAAVLALIVWGCMKFFGGSGDNGEVMNAYVDIGSITSTVSGDALSRAKDSASMTLTTSGTVQEIFVSEGDHVEAGQQLYKIQSDTAEDAVTQAKKSVDSTSKELKKLQENAANLTVRAPFSGKIQLPEDTKEIKVGDDMASGTTIATLVDDSKMKLTQYYSYAYAKDIETGQSVTVSIPSSMTTVKGTVSGVHMVERISAEGSKLFEVDLVMNNPGTLAAGVEASATITVGSNTIYPYEAGKLEYNQAQAIVTKVGGPVERVNLRNYDKVSAGEVLLVMGGDDNDTAIFDMESQLKTAQKNLEEAQKALDLLNGVSPISGTVMSVSMEVGQEVATGTTVMVVSDTTVIQLDANVDERNISYIKQGMSVDVTQNENQFMGTVTSVSLTSKAENGVATFPVVISVDNSDGTVLAGSYAQYSLVASQSNDCMVLPIQAVKSVETAEGTKTVVFVHTDTRPDNAIDVEVPPEGVPETGYWAVPVTTGINDAQNVEIKDGVEVGTEVFQQVMYSNMY